MPTHIRRFREQLDRMGLAPWPRYEDDPSFRGWIDSGQHEPDYSFAWLISQPPFVTETA